MCWFWCPSLGFSFCTTATSGKGTWWIHGKMMVGSRAGAEARKQAQGPSGGYDQDTTDEAMTDDRSFDRFSLIRVS